MNGAMALFAPIAGRLVDRYNTHKVFMSSGMVVVAAMYVSGILYKEMPPLAIMIVTSTW